MTLWIFPLLFKGDYQYSGRDSLIFLVDASKAMFQSYEEGEDDDDWTSFEMTIQVRVLKI